MEIKGGRGVNEENQKIKAMERAGCDEADRCECYYGGVNVSRWNRIESK